MSCPTTELLSIGRVAKAHGLRGEVVVELWSDVTDRLARGAVLTTDQGTLTVDTSRPFRDRWIVTFEGVHDRTAAERLHGTELRAEPIEVPDHFFVHELIGSPVHDIGGQPLGTVTAVEANPASDLLVLEGGALIPLRFVTGRGDDGALVVDVPEGLLDP